MIRDEFKLGELVENMRVKVSLAHMSYIHYVLLVNFEKLTAE